MSKTKMMKRKTPQKGDNKKKNVAASKKQETVEEPTKTTTTITTTPETNTTTEEEENFTNVQVKEQQKQKKKKSKTTKKVKIVQNKRDNYDDNDDDDDEDEKVDEDELKSILNQFDKAHEAHMNQEAAEADGEDESSKLEITLETVPENDDDLIIKTDEKSRLYKAPPVHFFTHIRKRFLKMQIQLHKIPSKFMQVDLEDDHFTVDTTKHTRKLFLQRKYPGLVKVDKNNAKAELGKGDILTIWVPILSMPKVTYDKELGIVQGRIKEKSIKFQPEVKKIIAERAKKAAKKSAQKKRRREKEKFFEQGLDIKKKKQKTN